MYGRIVPLLFALGGLGLISSCSDDSGPTTTPDQSVPAREAGPDIAKADAKAPDAAPLIEGFGRSCAVNDPCTEGTELGCLYKPADSYVGFCTLECTTPGKICPGTPAGTVASCALHDTKTNKWYCLFLCVFKSDGKEYTATCPNELNCGTDQYPAGSGQRICLP